MDGRGGCHLGEMRWQMRRYTEIHGQGVRAGLLLAEPNCRTRHQI